MGKTQQKFDNRVRSPTFRRLHPWRTITISRLHYERSLEMFNKILGYGLVVLGGITIIGLCARGGNSHPRLTLPKTQGGHELVPVVYELAPAPQSFSPNGAITYQPGVAVQGYSRSNGTYLAPHHRSNPDHNFYNNWSTWPNVNPYTGQTGTRHTPSHTSGIGSFRSGSSGHGGRR